MTNEKPKLNKSLAARWSEVEPEHWQWRVWLVDEELDKKREQQIQLKYYGYLIWQHFEIPY